MKIQFNKKSFWTFLKEYGLISLGLLSYVLGWTIFLLPNNLVGGGVSGISAIIQYATGGRIPMGWSYFVINVVLLIFGFCILGKAFGGKTIYAIIYTSVLLNVLPGCIPEEFIRQFSTINGPLLCTIIGGILSGVGIGVSISQGGSSGGTDIIALIVCKYRNVSPGRLILAMDVIIITSSLFFPSYTADGELVGTVQKIATAAYGFVLITVCSYAIDLSLAGSRQSVQAFIFSKHYKEIADAIAYDLHRGVTVMHSQGWYTKEESSVLMVLARKTDLSLLLRCIKSIDPDAFISIASVMGVYGKGFDTIKLRNRSLKGLNLHSTASKSSDDAAVNASEAQKESLKS